MHILNNVALSDYTTFQIGGKASYFANPNSLDELRQAVHFAKENALPIFILGAGSNLLVSDKGFGGLVIKPGMKQIRFSESGKDTLLTADAGCRWDDVVAAACEKKSVGH
jgi:UDP-N-acetylmuramate dehydrogenase